MFSHLLIVLNSLDNLSQNLSKAFFIANKFNLHPEILFVKELPLFDIESIFKDEEEINKEEIKETILNTLKELKREEVAVLVEIDDTKDRIFDIIKEDRSYLILHFFNEITFDILDDNPQSLFAVKSLKNEYKKVLFIFEYFDNIEEKIEYFLKYFPNLEVAYNFNYIPESALTEVELASPIEINEVLLETQQKLFEEFIKKYNLKGDFFINRLDGEIDILEYAKDYELVIVGNYEELLFDSLANDILKETKEDNLIIKESNALF